MLLGLSLTAFAEKIQRIAFVNTERIYLEAVEMRVISQKLEQEFAAEQKVLEAMEQKGQELHKELTRKGFTKKSEVNKLQMQLAKLDHEYLAAQSRFMEEYNLRRNEEFAAFQQKANQVIIDVAKQGHYDFILQDGIYINQEFDVTDQVIKLLNKK